jgi:hypothetical protein
MIAALKQATIYANDPEWPGATAAGRGHDRAGEIALRRIRSGRLRDNGIRETNQEPRK